MPHILSEALTRRAGDPGERPRSARGQGAPCRVAQRLTDEGRAAGRDPFDGIVDRDLSRLDKAVERLRQFLRDRGM